MRTTWDETWMNVADAIAKRSACTRSQVGAVIVDHNQRIVATGYNGPPATLTNLHGEEASCQNDCIRNIYGPEQSGYDDCIAIHAEANALLFCDRRYREGGTIYITRLPCYGCAKLIANSGLSRVVAKMVEFCPSAFNMLSDSRIEVVAKGLTRDRI